MKTQIQHEILASIHTREDNYTRIEDISNLAEFLCSVYMPHEKLRTVL